MQTRKFSLFLIHANTCYIYKYKCFRKSYIKLTSETLEQRIEQRIEQVQERHISIDGSLGII
jgi:hypothetical protein